MIDILFIFILWFVSPVVVNQSRQRWIIFKTFKKKISSTLSSKASESLINSTYYFFLTLFTYYFMHKMMSHNRFTYRIISCDLRLRICVWIV
jgi:membrane associated rhomboid family serine protease